MKNHHNLDSVLTVLSSNIKLGEVDGFNLYDIYLEAEPLTSLGQDVINLEKDELLILLDQALWAIRGIYERFERVQNMEEQGRNVSKAMNITQDKLAAYQAPFAEKGKKFPSGKPEGAISESTKYIRELVKNNPKLSVKKLLKLPEASNKLLDNMAEGTFKNQVTAARKKLNK